MSRERPAVVIGPLLYKKRMWHKCTKCGRLFGTLDPQKRRCDDCLKEGEPSE